MSTIYLRAAKGSPLTNDEVDANFTNLNTDKIEVVDAVSDNVGNKLVRRDANGNFSAGTITASLNGTSTSATISNNLSGGSLGSIPYQSAPNVTLMLSPGAINTVLRSTGPTGVPTWQENSLDSVNVNSTQIEYPLMTTVVNGAVKHLEINSEGFSFQPSTKSLRTDTLLIGGAAYSADYKLNVLGSVNVSGSIRASQGLIGNASTVTNGVYTNTNQTITGNKIFSGDVNMTGTISGNAILNRMFPVGAVYITINNMNPGTFLGGTWTQIAQGRTLIGVGTLGSDTYVAGATGGSATVTLSLAQIPSHDHGGLTSTINTSHSHTGSIANAGSHSHSVSVSSNGNHRHDLKSPSGEQYYVLNDRNDNPPSVDKTDGAFLSQGPSYPNDAHFYPYTSYAGAHSHSATISTNGDHSHTLQINGNSAYHQHTVYSQGGGGAHENRMPYLAVYFWQRTA